MNLTNIRRDGLFTTIYDTAKSPVSTAVAATVKALKASSGDQTVYDTSAQLRIDRTVGVTVAAASYSGACCFMSQPFSDLTPYRIKGYARFVVPDNDRFALFIGYAPATITGTDDSIAENIVLPIVNGEFDEIVHIPKLPSGDTYEDRALAFGILVGACTSQVVLGALSVQKLSVNPPAFAMSVS